MVNRRHERPECLVSQGWLFAINIAYIVVAIIIIAVAAVAKGGSYVTDIKVLGGVVAAGVLLLLVAILGIIGAALRSQPVLLVYMMLLGIICLIQFAVSVAALAVTDSQQEAILREGFCDLSTHDKCSLQLRASCLGFKNSTLPGEGCLGAATCSENPSCYDAGINECDPCFPKLQDQIEAMLRKGGGVGLGFVFTEVLGIWAAWSFRNYDKNRQPKYRQEEF